MRLGELIEIFEADPEGIPLDPMKIDDPDGKEAPAEPEKVLEPAKK